MNALSNRETFVPYFRCGLNDALNPLYIPYEHKLLCGCQKIIN